MNNPFHLSFVVPELRLTENFYVNFLGCKKGRDTGEWIDIIFFGHQLTLHQETESMKAQSIDHFGVILSKVEWLSISEKVKCANITFELLPSEKVNEDNSESGSESQIKNAYKNVFNKQFKRAKTINMANPKNDEERRLINEILSQQDTIKVQYESLKIGR